MLVEFQKALADLTASPELCIEMTRNENWYITSVRM